MDPIVFTIAGLIIVGMSWCLVGVILGRAPKDGFDTGIVLFTGAIVSVLCSTVIALCTGVASNAPLRVTLITLAVYLVQGVLNFFGMQSMAQGMRRGPNGVVWGITQSALVFPFTVGIVVFGTEPTFWRLSGIACLLIGLVFYAMTQGGRPESAKDLKGSWRFFAFLAFSFIAVQQTLVTTPSYFPEARQVSSILRTLAGGVGGLVGYSILFGMRVHREGKAALTAFENYRHPRFWAYIFCLQFFSLLFAYTLLYPGMDKMAERGAGAVSYPLMVASCIIAFTIYSFTVLKEKPTVKQILALVFCLIGLGCMCVQ